MPLEDKQLPFITTCEQLEAQGYPISWKGVAKRIEADAAETIRVLEEEVAKLSAINADLHGECAKLDGVPEHKAEPKDPEGVA